MNPNSVILASDNGRKSERSRSSDGIASPASPKRVLDSDSQDGRMAKHLKATTSAPDDESAAVDEQGLIGSAADPHIGATPSTAITSANLDSLTKNPLDQPQDCVMANTNGSEASRQQMQGSQQANANLPPERPLKYPGIQLEPETRPITLNQLVNEVKGIYVGLVMVESKCIEIDSDQGNAQTKFTDEQWQALITLHRTLLHEHHDFMLASQHPSGSPALRRLAQKYAMPARMWRHGIHSFLELLRHRLPDSQEHMVTFIYLAYSMVALLFETVPAFEDTWIECLGDLSRYRMAIEDDNQRIRDTWSNVSREWYTLASRRAPTTGRLYHHRAILARQQIILQLYYYTKSLCVPIPFSSTRESILTLFEPVLNGNVPRVNPADLAFTKANAILFTGKLNSQFLPTASQFHKLLPRNIEAAGKSWIETGAHIAIVLCCAQLNYGSDDNVLMKLLRQPPIATISQDSEEDRLARNTRVDDLARPQSLALETDRIVLSRVGDTHCYGYVHVLMIWLLSMAQLPGAMRYLEKRVAWPALVTFLNGMLDTYERYDRLELETIMHVPDEAESTSPASPASSTTMAATTPATPTDSSPLTTTIPHPPRQRSIEDKPLPEDWALWGMIFTQKYFPAKWFGDATNMDDNEAVMETPAMTPIRCERILWLAVQLAQFETWILYDLVMHKFSVAPAFEDDESCDEGADDNDDDEEGARSRNEEDDDINLSGDEQPFSTKDSSTSTGINTYVQSL